jgi:hypothetical protein
VTNTNDKLNNAFIHLRYLRYRLLASTYSLQWSYSNLLLAGKVIYKLKIKHLNYFLAVRLAASGANDVNC